MLSCVCFNLLLAAFRYQHFRSLDNWKNEFLTLLSIRLPLISIYFSLTDLSVLVTTERSIETCTLFCLWVSDFYYLEQRSGSSIIRFTAAGRWRQCAFIAHQCHLMFLLGVWVIGCGVLGIYLPATIILIWGWTAVEIRRVRRRCKSSPADGAPSVVLGFTRLRCYNHC